jgi:hypothetical protein
MTWDESKHPRVPRGSGDKGGEFTHAAPIASSPYNPAISLEQYNAFKDLADAQRGHPESAMLAAQDALSREPYFKSANALGNALEHVGDLTNRMSQANMMWPGTRFGRDYVDQKVNTGLRFLNNTTDMANMRAIPLFPELLAYSDAHSRLPTHNLAQRSARDAAVSLGRMDFGGARRHLMVLRRMLDDGSYEAIAGSYKAPNISLNIPPRFKP